MDYKTQGNAQYAQKNYQAAADLYTQALLEDPHLAAALANRSQCWLQLNRFQEAWGDAEAALQLDVTDALRLKLLFRSAQAQRQLGLGTWLDAVRQGLAIDPQNTALLDLSEREWTVQDAQNTPEVPLDPPAPQSHAVHADAPASAPAPPAPAGPAAGGPTFHPPKNLTYASIINSTRTPSPAAFDWWQQVDPAAFKQAHRGQVEPSTLKFFRKMKATHNAAPLLQALAQCPGYDIADMLV